MRDLGNTLIVVEHDDDTMRAADYLVDVGPGNHILYKSLAQKINKSKVKPGDYDKIDGIDHLDKIIDIDQSPIGRTPRSNPATYTGVFDDIRDVFAQTNEAKIRGYQKGRFSFNVKVAVVKLVKVTASLK